MKQIFQAVVIGLGPAGMAAAIELARAGVKTAVIDEDPAPGGQVYRQPPSDFQPSDYAAPGPRKSAGSEMIQRFNQIKPQLTILDQAQVWGVSDPSGLSLIHRGRPLELGFEKLVICEGARERILPFPGWTLPGVMTAGGIQKMLSHQRLLPGRRVLLSGSGPLQISVAAALARAGAKIVGLCEAVTAKAGWWLIPALLGQGINIREALSYLAVLRRHSVPIRRPLAIISAGGGHRLETATIARLDREWRPIPGTEQTIEVDLVGLGYGFQPSARLTRLFGCRHVYDLQQCSLLPETDRMMRTSRRNIYAAGDCTGIGGADLSAIEGQLAGLDLAGSLGRLSPDDLAPRVNKARKARQKAQRYASSLNSIFYPRPGYFSVIDRQTVICRCEGVTAGRLWDEVAQGRQSLVELKPSRIAMGSCQGRICESIVTELLRLKGVDADQIGHLHLRPPISPIAINVFDTRGPIKNMESNLD